MSGDSKASAEYGPEPGVETDAEDSGFDPGALGLEMADDVVDKPAAEADDATADDEFDESEFGEDVPFDSLETFMADDPEDVEEYGMEEVDEFSDDLDALNPELLTTDGTEDAELVEEDAAPVATKRANGGASRAKEARRAIEERAERRRLQQDLDYLDFDLDD